MLQVLLDSIFLERERHTSITYNKTIIPLLKSLRDLKVLSKTLEGCSVVLEILISF